MLRRIIIAGSRSFNDYEELKRLCDYIVQEATEVEIVSGGCRGADLLGERYAKERGFDIKRFEADWDQHGKAAGPIRNEQMAEYADELIAFHCGGRGTADMIRRAKTHGLKYAVSKHKPS